jgi:hypothetical protein
MKARLKFLIETMGWDTFRSALNEERARVGPVPLSDYFRIKNEVERDSVQQRLSGDLPVLDPRTFEADFQSWVHDSVIAHKVDGFRGVHVRVKLGDLTSARARGLAAVGRRFSRNQLRISIDQNIYLPWVRAKELPALYEALGALDLGERGAGTIADVTTCPGSDTCRLGIASAKGWGAVWQRPTATALKNGGDSLAPAGALAAFAHDFQFARTAAPSARLPTSVFGGGTPQDRAVPAYCVTVGGGTQLTTPEVWLAARQSFRPELCSVDPDALELYARKKDSQSRSL